MRLYFPIRLNQVLLTSRRIQHSTTILTILHQILDRSKYLLTSAAVPVHSNTLTPQHIRQPESPGHILTQSVLPKHHLQQPHPPSHLQRIRSVGRHQRRRGTASRICLRWQSRFTYAISFDGMDLDSIIACKSLPVCQSLK